MHRKYLACFDQSELTRWFGGQRKYFTWPFIWASWRSDFKGRTEACCWSSKVRKSRFTVLPTGFGKSVIYQSFVIAKDFSSIVIIVPLLSIIDDQLQSNDFGLKAVAFEKKPELMQDINCCQQISSDFCLDVVNKFSDVSSVLFKIYLTYLAKVRRLTSRLGFLPLPLRTTSFLVYLRS